MLTSNGYVLPPERLGALAPAESRDDRAALWERLRRDGYLYLPGALDPAVVLDFRRHYFATLAETGLTAAGSDPVEGRAGTDVDRGALRRLLFDVLVPGPEYAALCDRLRGWFAWFYDSDPFLHRRKIIRHVRPGETGIGTATQAHYDLVYLREGTDRLLSVWIPLGDCPVERGGLTYLEGSHHRVLREEQAGRQRPAASITANLPALAEEYDTRWLVTDYAAGDIVVHSPYLVHAALDNTDPTRTIRLSTDIRYQRATDPIDWRWQQHWHDDDGL